MTTVPMRRKSGLGCFTQVGLALVLGVVVIFGVIAIVAPWGFYMGGRFHLIPTWEGWGKMHSNSAGGDYVLLMSFSPKTGKGLGLTHVSGNAWLCTPRGEKFTLSVGGDFEKHMGLDTNGKKASFYMLNRTASHIFGGGSAKPELELRGRWNNPDLVLDDHSSIQRNFDHDAKLYPDGKNRPYLGEVSQVILHEGGKSDFDAACAAVKSK